QIVVLRGCSPGWVEDVELAVGLELQDVAGATDGGERGRRPDRGQGAGIRGRAGRAKYAGTDQVAVDQVGVEPDLGDRLLLAGRASRAVVADEDVAGRVERDAGDPRERQGRDHSRLEPQEARTKRPSSSIAAPPGRTWVGSHGSQVPLLSILCYQS